MTDRWYWDNIDTLEPEQERADDVAFFRETAVRSGGPVLDLGCGAGRLAIPLARAGLEVVGLDISAPTLRSFRGRLRAEPPDVRARVKATCADMRRFALRRKFRCAICSSNTILLLASEKAIKETLDCVASHVRPDGIIVIDVTAVDETCRAALREYPEGDFPDIASRTHRVHSCNDGAETNTLSITYTYFDRAGGLRAERCEEALILTPSEFLALLDKQGFEVLAKYGWYDRRPFSESERKLLVVARRSRV